MATEPWKFNLGVSERRDIGKDITKSKPSTVGLLRFCDILAVNFKVKDVNVTGNVLL